MDYLTFGIAALQDKTSQNIVFIRGKDQSFYIRSNKLFCYIACEDVSEVPGWYREID
ncbi:hypothetical protein ES703_123737 [subsurface metagenome]